MRDDLSILIQGPINEVSLGAIDDYVKFTKNIIISTWNLVDTDILNLNNRFNNICNLKIVTNTQPDYVSLLRDGKIVGIPNNTTFYWQILGISNGVNECDTKYIIRTRSDEYYKNLNPLIEQVENNGFKFTCGNIWFRKKNIVSMHIGDHLYFSETELLKKSLKTLLDIYHQKYENSNAIKYLSYMAAGGGGQNTPEQILAKMILTNYKKIDISNQIDLLNFINLELSNDELFKKVFDVIDINKLTPIKWNWTHGGASGDNLNDETIIKNINEY